MYKTRWIFIAYVIISLIAFASILFFNKGTKNKVKDELSSVEFDLKSEQQKNQAYAEILALNAMENEVNINALETNIHSLLERSNLTDDQEAFLKSQLGLIQTIKDSVLMMRQGDQLLQDSIVQLKNKSTMLLAALDSVQQTNRLKRKELQKELRQLRSVVDLKSDQLKRQHKVKVISFMSSKGKKVHYLGEVVNEQANGGGIGIWSTGGMYQGDWENNQRHGEGRYVWSNEHVYEGEFKNDVREGEGTYYWPSGERYEGEWSNDRRSGQGTLYDKDGNIQYQGEWKNDKVVD